MDNIKALEFIKFINDMASIEPDSTCRNCPVNAEVCNCANCGNVLFKYFFCNKNEPLPVKIKLVEGGKMPTKGTPGAAAFDCYAKEDTTLLKGSSPNKIPLGFCLEIPTGYHAKILPRSSTGLNTPVRIPNACGIIDSDYRGEVNFIGELNFSWGAGHYFVTKGTRIAQMIIEKNEEVELIEVDELSDTERGSGGFGSTGK